MLVGNILPAILTALLVTLLLTPWLGRYLVAVGVVDLPGVRRSHVHVTPRGGGLAMAAGLLLGLVWILPGAEDWLAIGLLVVALSLLGWLDDCFEVSIRWRLLVQLVISVFMVAAVGGVSSISIPGIELEWRWFWSLLAVPAIIWLVNLHNFMDGSDGLAANQGIWVGLGYGTLFWNAGRPEESGLAFLLSAVCVGFMVWNRPPARIFMGDAGSLLLGGVIAWLALVGAATDTIGVWLTLAICALFATDATATLVRRLIQRERWYTPHRQHAYQRLITAGWSHCQVLMLYAVVNVVIVLAAVLVGLNAPDLDFWLALGVVSVLTIGWFCIQSAFDGDPKTHD